MVNGEYFIFIDGDDMLTENYVETILKYIDEDSESDIHTFKARLYPFGAKIDLNISLCNKVIKTSFLKEHLINFDGAIVFLEDNYFLDLFIKKHQDNYISMFFPCQLEFTLLHKGGRVIFIIVPPL